MLVSKYIKIYKLSATLLFKKLGYHFNVSLLQFYTLGYSVMSAGSTYPEEDILKSLLAAVVIWI